MVTQEKTQIVKVNIIANLYAMDKNVHIINMHLSNTRPKQFEDNFGNLWNSSELNNFEHLK
jgi:hypothetical protein